jgi:CDP-6-deoxy-D-xylo-4-hexulose-3-dehydrase
MSKEDEIRQEIFSKISDLWALREQTEQEFIPGVSSVPYAGRVYDEKELISLVDASLDFWLTSGRNAEQFEKDLAAFLGVKYCLLTNSGSSANLLAVSALTSQKLGKKRIHNRMRFSHHTQPYSPE